MRASCNEDLHSSSELPSLSQWLFMSFSLACSSRDSSVSACTNSLLHRLMDRTMGLRLSYAFCSSCGNTPHVEKTSSRETFEIVSRGQQRYLELLDALLYGLDVGAEVQPPLLLQLLLRGSQPSPDIVQVRVQLLPLLLVLLRAHLFAEVLSLQELPALDHSWMAGCYA